MKNISVFIEGTGKKTFKFKKPIITYGTRLAAKEITVFWNFKNITSAIGNGTFGIKNSPDKTINDGYYDFQTLKTRPMGQKTHKKTQRKQTQTPGAPLEVVSRRATRKVVRLRSNAQRAPRVKVTGTRSRTQGPQVPEPRLDIPVRKLGSMVSKRLISPTYKWDILGLLGL